MTNTPTDESGTQEQTANARKNHSRATRRRFLRATGASLVGLSVLPAVSSAQGQNVAESFEFGGEVQAWQGRSPQSIQGQQNPTLELQTGNVYEVTWENLDGQPHNFALQDSDGQNLPVIFPDVQTNMGGGGQGGNQGGGGGDGQGGGGGQVTPPGDALDVTETVSQQGATQTLQFVATQDVAQYICVIHPTTMVGEVSLQGGGGGGGNGGGNGGGGN
ncbi:hypothetical protein SAMN05421858_1264 [Haladaptatus litoreus]|uniref:Copper binding protein, plastocyanin/azurin family n=1 Tax=Haladaptatus litoreus TaxID=553468 RepID=A0A1N6XTJ0_9EURY|nr:hypothetical protein [Haladaptatus litoreus]SIR05519.1 hypothetical protein SAMN05421858_1264 [Haladaptatus litoreus]